MQYTQLIGIVFDAFSVLLGFMRLIVHGVPAARMASSARGAEGLVYVLSVLHIASLVVVVRFRHVFGRYCADNRGDDAERPAA